MGVFAISDLHLPAHQKPMDIFGEHWENHFQRICEDWVARVGADDVVLLSGDLSWAMRLEEAMDDLRSIAALPGKKILLRGNHDYWWSAISRVRESLGEGMYAVQNDCISVGGYVFAGSRGWTLPTGKDEEDDLRIYARERLRLELSLKEAKRRFPDEVPIVMMHFPPLSASCIGFSDILEAYGVRDCVYGHLHGAALNSAIRGEIRGVRYHCTSCDGLGFRLYQLTGL